MERKANRIYNKKYTVIENEQYKVAKERYEE